MPFVNSHAFRIGDKVAFMALLPIKQSLTSNTFRLLISHLNGYFSSLLDTNPFHAPEFWKLRHHPISFDNRWVEV